MTAWNGQPLDAQGVAELCTLLGGRNCPVAVVTTALMVVGQNAACADTLYDGMFYSLYDYLSDAVCAALTDSLRRGQPLTMAAAAGGHDWELSLRCMGEQGLLILRPAVKKNVAVLQTSQLLRDMAENLILNVFELESEGQTTMALRFQREAMQLLRQARHLELLGGAELMLNPERCDMVLLAEEMQQQLARRGVAVELVSPAGPLYLELDRSLVQSAVLSLVSNSLRHNQGQRDLRIRLLLQSNGSEVLLAVEDNGSGIADAGELLSAWRDETAVPEPGHPAGLGLSYARHVAELHSGRLVIDSGDWGSRVVLSLRGLDQGDHQLRDTDFYQDSDDPAEIELSVNEEWFTGHESR